MKNIYLKIFAATIALGITGCLEDMAANTNANTNANANAESNSSTTPQETTPTVTPPAAENTVIDPTTTPDPLVTPDPVNVDPAGTPTEVPSTPATTPQVIVTASGDIYMIQGGDTTLVQKGTITPYDEDDETSFTPLVVGDAMSASQLQPSDCKNEFWCGAKKDATIDADFGPGEWFAYTDERDDGNSYWTWPAADWEGIVSACNGICGVSTLGPAYMYPYMGFGFFLTENHDAVDITEWGGICVTYSTDTKMRIGLHPNEEGQAAMEYNDFRVALTPGKNITKNFAWSDFKQDIGWGKAYDRDLLLTQIVEIVFAYQDMGAGSVSSFNISKIGKYGTCN